MDRKLPDLSKSNLEPRVQRELEVTFIRLYEYIDAKIREVEERTSDVSIRNTSQFRELGTLLGDFATKLIGEAPSENPLEVLSTSDGTVQSVGINGSAAFNAIITILNSPIISSGVIQLILNVQGANTILAAPNGGAGLPSFRLLNKTDVKFPMEVTTHSNADPTAGDYPAGTWGVHKNDVSGDVFVAFNDGGNIKTVLLIP